MQYRYTVPTKVKKFLKGTELFINYSDDIDLEDVPEAVLTVPFVANVLTIAMLTGCGIKVECVDKVFYESIPKIEEVYRKMFPHIKLTFCVKAEKTMECSYECVKNKSLFFTGGLDATSALASVYEKDMTLVNIWGGDVGLEDYDTHCDLEHYLQDLSNRLEIKYTFIRSNCREMYNEREISKLTALKIPPKDNHGWWASIAHVLAMVSLVAPYAYVKRIGINMLASSYTKDSKVFDANNQLLIDAIRFCSCEMKSVDGNLERTDKAKNIIQFSQNRGIPIKLKVCWFRHAGENCSACEKCYRTILDILVSDGDPNQYGFNANRHTYQSMKEFLSKTYVNKCFWNEIQAKFNENRSEWEKDENVAWILDIEFNRPIAIYNKAISVIRKFFPKK